VTCPNGHRFPVNLKKHTNRRERICPQCRAEVIVRKRFFFTPNPKWQKQKEEQSEATRQKREQKRPAMEFVNAFLTSLAMNKRMEEEEKQKNAPAEG